MLQYFSPFYPLSEGPFTSSQFTVTSASVDIFVSSPPVWVVLGVVTECCPATSSAAAPVEAVLGVWPQTAADLQFPGYREDAYLFICLLAI